MKKAIFLVEDIKDNKIITLLERVYEKLILRLHETGYPFLWISEIGQVLNASPSDFIIFKKADEFVNEIKDKETIPADVNVFYFISTWLHLKTFHITNFFTIDPNITDFLVKHNIPIIIDGSMEMDDIHTSSYNLFESNKNFFEEKNHINRYFRGIKNLKFHVIGSEIGINPMVGSDRYFDVNHCFFPTAFFRVAHFNSPAYLKAAEQKEILFSEIEKKKITLETPIWQAFCRTPRLTRVLFQLWVDKDNLQQFGRYSRLLPAKDAFLQECETAGIFYKYQENLRFITEKHLEELKKTQIIDDVSRHLPDGLPFKIDPMFHVVLETCPIRSGEEFDCTPSMLTEKTSMAILSGAPFITLGGHKLKKILKLLGFREYKGLELPDIEQQNFFDELDYVIGKIKTIINLSLDEKQELYDSWKENIKFNYDLLLSLDTKRLYLEFLNHPI
jgi:hypothetical protein